MRKEDIEWLAKQVEILVTDTNDLKKLLLESASPLRNDMADAILYRLHLSM